MVSGDLGPALTYPSPAGASEAGGSAPVSSVLQMTFVSGRSRAGCTPEPTEPAEAVCSQSYRNFAVLGATWRAFVRQP